MVKALNATEYRFTTLPGPLRALGGATEGDSQAEVDSLPGPTKPLSSDVLRPPRAATADTNPARSDMDSHIETTRPISDKIVHVATTPDMVSTAIIINRVAREIICLVASVRPSVRLCVCVFTL